MTLFYNNLFRHLSFFILFFSPQLCIPVFAKQSMTVRVLLSQARSKHTWTFVSSQGFLISLLTDNAKKKYNKKELKIVVKNGQLFCNGKKVSRGLVIKPVSGHVECDGISYDGYFCIVPDKEKFLCINYVDLEDYIIAVLRTESWPGWPLEVNKSFAITCRSYVAAKVLEAKKTNKLYDVKNTNAHQTYRGKHGVAVLQQAVDQTRSIVLGFEGKPILTMFDSCCGGIIPADITDFDFNKASYLARKHPCTHCKKCSLYSWHISYEISLFEQKIKPHIKSIGKIRDIYVIEKDPAGLVLKLMIKGTKGHTLMSGKQLYSLLKEVKSFYFDVQKKGNEIVITGRGFGHHIGLCQWGARQMVRDGWDYKSILQFYYPKTNFMKLL